MELRSIAIPRQEQQEKSLFLFVVVVGYILTFTTAVNGGTRYSVLQLLVGILCGVVYLVLGFFEEELLRSVSRNRGNMLFFSVEIMLVYGIGWTLGPGGNWLIGLPLAGLAVEKLSARARWFVYAGILGAIVLPILHYSTWDTALMNGFAISAAIFFVDVITKIRLNEQRSRERAEGLARQLETAHHQLAEYASQAEELAATQERNRLAREIHDNLGHYLTIVNVQIEVARATLSTDPARALDALEKAQELARKGLASVRQSVSALRVSPVEDRSLEDALTSLLEETRLSGVPVELHVLGNPMAVDKKIALAFYRLVQEALTNIRKHARASQVNVDLDFSQPAQIRLAVRDDGVGAAETGGGFGLVGIRERVRLLQGRVTIETSPGTGFCIEAVIPAERAEA